VDKPLTRGVSSSALKKFLARFNVLGNYGTLGFINSLKVQSRSETFKHTEAFDKFQRTRKIWDIDVCNPKERRMVLNERKRVVNSGLVHNFTS